MSETNEHIYQDVKPGQIIAKTPNMIDTNPITHVVPQVTQSEDEKRLSELRNGLTDLLQGTTKATGLNSKVPEDSSIKEIDLSEKATQEARVESSGKTARNSEDPRVIKETLDARNISDYESCYLNEEEKLQLLSDIKVALSESRSEQRTLLLNQLYEHINKHGRLFTEFSQGTGSLIIGNLLAKGLIAYGAIEDESEIKYGEGTMSAERIEGIHKISVGVGQGGLGTAIAYAEMTENPAWNLRIYNAGIYNDYRTQKMLKEQLRDTSLSFEEQSKRVQLLQAIQKKLSDALGDEYPLVVGFDRSEKVESILDPQVNIQTQLTSDSPYFNTDQLTSSIDKTSIGELDSEAQLPRDDVVPPPQLAMFTCPLRNMDNLQERIQGREIGLISFEALDLLKEFGFSRIARAHDAASYLLHQNATQTVSERYLAWRRKSVLRSTS